jgi:enamine deaminase RidA (YjgF/YER057c/UK114 family)
MMDKVACLSARSGTCKVSLCSPGGFRPLQRHKHDNTRSRFPFGRQALYERNRYSPAIKSNGFLFVSGQVGSREDGSPEEDLNAQIRLAFDNLNAVLAAAGCTFDDVVDVTLFVVDPESNLDAIWSILPEYWGSALPYVDRDRRDVAVRIPV